MASFIQIVYSVQSMLSDYKCTQKNLFMVFVRSAGIFYNRFLCCMIFVCTAITGTMYNVHCKLCSCTLHV